MTRSEIDEIFRRTYNEQTNFMTPNIITRGKHGSQLYEISTGTGIGGRAIYGVTVLSINGEKQPKLSTCFGSLSDAQNYIEEVL